MVPNPSFEDTTGCPNAPGDIDKAVGWTHNGSSDYFNTCGIPTSTGVPNTFGGYQQPASGNAFAGIVTYYSLSNNYRELISHDLSTPLSVGAKYYVSFKTCLSLGSSNNANCSTNKLGVLFSTFTYTGFYQIITNNPPIYTNSVLTDSLNWTRVFGSFIADSAYTNIIVGNFFDDANTDTTHMYNNFSDLAYYFIDDVCVTTDSLYALNYTYTGIKESSLSSIPFYPNPASDYIVVNNVFNTEMSIKIRNVVGQELFSVDNISENNYKIDLSKLKPEVLIINITSDNRTTNYKFLKQ